LKPFECCSVELLYIEFKNVIEVGGVRRSLIEYVTVGNLLCAQDPN
jgi:hypothetical protein